MRRSRGLPVRNTCRVDEFEIILGLAPKAPGIGGIARSFLDGMNKMAIREDERCVAGRGSPIRNTDAVEPGVRAAER